MVNLNLKKTFKENTIASVLLLLVVAYILYMLYKYLDSRGKGGMETMAYSTNSAYGSGKTTNGLVKNNDKKGGVRPAEPMGQNEVFSSAKGIQTTMQGVPSSSCGSTAKANITNPAELLPKDTNAGWAQLNPSGQGMLANINLLKAGYNIGIDTIGSSMRNANLQIRSEPPNPQHQVSIWSNSTITPDFLRVPLEIGSGSQ